MEEDNDGGVPMIGDGPPVLGGGAAPEAEGVGGGAGAGEALQLVAAAAAAPLVAAGPPVARAPPAPENEAIARDDRVVQFSDEVGGVAAEILTGIKSIGADAFKEDTEHSVAADAFLEAENVLLNSGGTAAASSRAGVTKNTYSLFGVLLAPLSFILYLWFVPQYVQNYVADVTAKGGRALQMAVFAMYDETPLKCVVVDTTRFGGCGADLAVHMAQLA